MARAVEYIVLEYVSVTLFLDGNHAPPTQLPDAVGFILSCLAKPAQTPELPPFPFLSRYEHA